MKLTSLPAAWPDGSPGIRLGLALGASLMLHVALLVPGQWWLPMKPPALPPLAVVLPPPELASEIATKTEQVPAPADAVSPVPILVPPEKPRELQGRALARALALLTLEEFYPREAIQHELEGRVVLLLTCDEGGRVVAAEVASSSGHPVLDEAALKAAARIGRLPARQRQVLLPVEFRLE